MKIGNKKLLTLLFIWGIAVSTGELYSMQHPLIGKKAPELRVMKWENLKKGQKIPRIQDYKDKVVYLYCYQNWCPGCHKYGFPAIKKISEEFKNNDDVVILVVQTVFEGFGTNTAAKMENVREEYQLDLPFGHDDGGGKGSSLMKDYKTRGTPWHIIIDKEGKVVFCDFHVDPEKTIQGLKKILAKK